MLRKLPKIVLLLMLLMAVATPFMQLDSLDAFPTSTPDIELQIISVLFEIGMFFVIAGILSLMPGLMRLRQPVVAIFSLVRDQHGPATVIDLMALSTPLRI